MKIKPPMFRISVVITYILFCALTLWCIIDKRIIIENLINESNENTIWTILGIILTFNNIVHIYKMENCNDLKNIYKIIYLIGLFMMLTSAAISYYYKTLFLLIPNLLGLLFSIIIIIKIFVSGQSFRPYKVETNKYMEAVQNSVKYKQFIKYVIIVYFYCVFVLNIFNTFEVALLVSNIYLVVFGIGFIALEIRKTLTISDNLGINKINRIIYSIINGIILTGIVVFINIILVLQFTMMIKAFIFCVIFITTNIWSDYEIRYKYLMDIIPKEYFELEYNLKLNDN